MRASKRGIVALFASLALLTASAPVYIYPDRVMAAESRYEEGMDNIFITNGIESVYAPEVYNVSNPDGDTSRKAWEILLSTGTLPVYVTSPTVKVNSKTYGFNFKLWQDKHIVVYGRPTDIGVNPRIPAVNGYKDFKTKEDDPSCGEYYLRDGKRGEYRYHGYDVSGNKYSNTSFPLDGPGQNMNEYRWIYKPWERSHRLTELSPWNDKVLLYYDNMIRANQQPTLVGQKLYEWLSAGFFKDEADTVTHQPVTTLNWINAMPPDDLDDVTNPSYNGRLAYNYAHVMSASTLLYPGEAKLWIEKNGSYRYRTCFIPEIKSKLLTPVTARIEVLKNETVDTVIRDWDDSPEYERYLNSVKTIEFRVIGTLEDKDYFGDQVLATVYYNRNDFLAWEEAWRIKLTDISNLGKAANPTYERKSAYYVDTGDQNAHGSAVFTINMKVSDIINAVKSGQREIEVRYQAVARFYSKQDKSAPVEVPSSVLVFKLPLTAEEAEMPVPEDSYRDGDPIPQIPDPPQYINPEVELPEPAFDIVKYKPKDNTQLMTVYGTPADIVLKEVLVDGTPVDYDHFFSGNFVFGETGYDRLANIIVKYTAVDGSVSYVDRWIRVLNTKPRVQFAFTGSYKENRKQSVANTSELANTPEVLQAFPIVSYSWKVEALSGGTDSDIKAGSLTGMGGEFTFKKPGTYRVTLTGTNTLGRTSDPYVYQFEILPDVAPAIICELDNVSIARGESIGAYFFEAVSTDGDAVEETRVYLYYDADNDGTPETLLDSWTDVANGAFPTYTPSRLGMYRWKIVSKERMEGDIIPGHVSPEDAKVKEIERDFWVDNCGPQTGIYLEETFVRPNVDVYILTDAGLPQAKTDHVKNSRMDYNNLLRMYNLMPVVEQWDMKTYTYSQPASTSLHTGTSYPPATTYYSSNGYSGTLYRTSVSDNGSYHDFGHYETREESRTFTRHSETNYVTETYLTNPWEKVNRTESNPAPPTYYINEDGYTGYLPRVGTIVVTALYETGREPSPYPNRTYVYYAGAYQAEYSGTLTKTVTYWVSDWRWVSDYTGFYSGTIYKSVRAPYVDPFRGTSDKYVIYVSDGAITDLNDLKMVLNRSGAELILVSGTGALNQITPARFFERTSNIAADMYKALNYIIDKYRSITELYLLAGIDTIDIKTDDFDQENDPIILKEFQYVHDPNCFDNPQGMESFAVDQFNPDSGWTDTRATMFSKVGKYTVYRRIKDLPTTDPNFKEYSYYSGTPFITVYAHRKPIAKAALDWDFDAAKGVYKTSWVDLSYDPDHQYSRPDRGIVERKIMFRRTGDNWSYVIPETLSPCTYELYYYVKDVEGVWSDPYVMNFTLENIPPMQFDAKLRPLDPRFSLDAIPASEYLEAFDLWTRSPYPTRLELALYNSSMVRVAPVKTVEFSESTGTKVGNDIYWNNVSYQVPESLPRDSYILRVLARETVNGRMAYKDFQVTVDTPINPRGYINGKHVNAEIHAGETNIFTLYTSKYVKSVEISFEGTTYSSYQGENPVELVGMAGEDKVWQLTLQVSSSLPDGKTGTAVFKAFLPSGEMEAVEVDYKVTGLRLANLRISCIADYAWQRLFQNPDGSPSALSLEGIGVEHMPVFVNSDGKGIKLGYKGYFKMDSMGLTEPEDSITVNVRYYALDTGNNPQPVDIWVKDEKGRYVPLELSPEFRHLASTIVLNPQEHRKAYEPDPASEWRNTWEFDMFLPPDAKAVPAGEAYDPFNDNSYKYRLLVVFDIYCTRASDEGVYNYTGNESGWGQSDGSVYGKNRPTGRKLLGYGDDKASNGEVFYYSLYETLLDDINIDRTW